MQDKRSTFSCCQKVLCSQIPPSPKYLIIPLHLTQISSRSKGPLKQNKAKTDFCEAGHIINDIPLHCPGATVSKVCSVEHECLSHVNFIISNKQTKRICDKITWGISGSNRFICCKAFQPPILNEHYTYLKEGYSM